MGHTSATERREVLTHRVGEGQSLPAPHAEPSDLPNPEAQTAGQRLLGPGEGWGCLLLSDEEKVLEFDSGGRCPRL